MLTKIQASNVTDLIEDVGINCILSHFKNISDQNISFKGSALDPVSLADKEAEHLLRQGLTKILPGSLFIGEESYAENKEILHYLSQSDHPVWVVDPIDGTHNFVKGKEGFGTMVALVYRTNIIASWLYEVCSQTMTTIIEGEIKINGSRFDPPPIHRDVAVGQIGRKLYQYPEVIEARKNLSSIVVDAANEPSIITYFKFLKGELDFLIYRLTYPWDHLPGLALLSGQNVILSRWNGEPFKVTDIHEGLVIARNRALLEKIQTQIIKPLSLSPQVLDFGK